MGLAQRFDCTDGHEAVQKAREFHPDTGFRNTFIPELFFKAMQITFHGAPDIGNLHL